MIMKVNTKKGTKRTPAMEKLKTRSKAPINSTAATAYTISFPIAFMLAGV
jgi:hypothetical protein